MYSREFCYWLQGYFELSNTDALTPSKISTIRNHLSMVEKVEGELKGFPAWLCGALDALSFDNNTGQVEEKYANMIKEKLDTSFKHVVDSKPSKPNTPFKPNNVPGQPDPTNQAYRC